MLYVNMLYMLINKAKKSDLQLIRHDRWLLMSMLWFWQQNYHSHESTKTLWSIDIGIGIGILASVSPGIGSNSKSEVSPIPNSHSLLRSIQWCTNMALDCASIRRRGLVHSKIRSAKLTPTVLILTLTKCLYVSTLNSVNLTLLKMLNS